MSSVSTADPAAAGAGGTAAGNRGRLPDVLVVGLGNPLLGDDGVGWRVVEDLERWLAEAVDGDRLPPLELDRLAVGGLGLMERLVGWRRAVLVDALESGPDPPGTVTILPFERLPSRSGHLDGAHDASLRAALDVGRALGAVLPTEIMVVAVRTEPVDMFGERLSPAVESAVPRAVDAVLSVLGLAGGREGARAAGATVGRR